MEIQATFRHLRPTEELQKLIFEGARDLDIQTGQVLAFCHVVVEGRPREHGMEATTVRAAVLGSTSALGVSHDLRARTSHESPSTAIAAAFDTIRGKVMAELARRETLERAEAKKRARSYPLREAIASWA
ncbi:MAG: hypothetical protein RBU30_19750 [Polyangia bacterium]|jgi:hypothetical protein|nr:hypothetical protein [Polyangia bacterium]